MSTLTIDTTEVEKDVIYAVGDLLELEFSHDVHNVVVIHRVNPLTKELAYNEMMLLDLTTFKVWRDRQSNVEDPSNITHNTISWLVGTSDCKITKKGHIYETNVKVEKEIENG